MQRKSFPLVVTLLSVFSILLAIVDLRRGFLFAEYLFKSPFIIFSPYQIVLLVVGVIGLKITAPALKLFSEKDNKKLLIGIFLILILDFVLYRGVAANKSLLTGKIGLDWLTAFGETGVMRPLYLTVSYLLTVWHATFLSCLLGGWGILALPYMTDFLKKQSGMKAGMSGTLYSFTQPLCSCCVAITSPSLINLPRSFAVSVLIGAPMLNLSTLGLAGTLLPWPFSILRILGGLGVTISLGLVINHFLAPNETEASSCEIRIPNDNSHLNLITNWFKQSGRLALWLFPSIVLGIVLTSLIWQFWPSEFLNSWSSVAVVSVLGSLLMVSTWSEIPLALELINHGLTGPAAAALIALPAVNLASLLLIGKSTKQWSLVLLMGVSIMVISFGIGIYFI